MDRTSHFVISTRVILKREARYLLKIQMGVSNAEFKHSKLIPIYGTGQGSANSPVIWCLISNRLFEAHDAHSHGATFRSPDGQYIRYKSI